MIIYAMEESFMSMTELLVWLYLINSVLLVNHEIDSAYWNEWKLFKLPGGINGFLVVHFPLLFLVFYGMILVYQGSQMGLIFSLGLSFAGIFAFITHMYFIKNGRNEFNVPISLFILVSALIVSLIQGAVTLYLLLE